MSYTYCERDLDINDCFRTNAVPSFNPLRIRKLCRIAKGLKHNSLFLSCVLGMDSERLLKWAGAMWLAQRQWFRSKLLHRPTLNLADGVLSHWCGEEHGKLVWASEQGRDNWVLVLRPNGPVTWELALTLRSLRSPPTDTKDTKWQENLTWSPKPLLQLVITWPALKSWTHEYITWTERVVSMYFRISTVFKAHEFLRGGREKRGKLHN